MKKTMLILLAAVLSLALFSCSSGPSASASAPAASAAQTAQSGLEITITKTEHSQGSGGIMPGRDTDEFVILTVQLKNTGKTALDFEAKDFHLQNSKDEETGSSPYDIGQAPALKSGTLQPGETAVGTLLYTEPKGTSLILLFGEQRIQVK
ncbi:MAG: DUF4352 domain-containing protein [Eubacteriales bacterium]